MDESLMNWKLAEIIDSWDEEDHDPTPDEEAAVSILLLIEGNADDLLILSNKYARADAAVISGIYALDAMQRRGVPSSVQSRFTRKLRLASCRLFDIPPDEMERMMANRLGVFSGLIRNARNVTSIADEAALLFTYDIKYNRYVDFFSDSPVILTDFSTQTQILGESKAFFQALFPLVLKSIGKYGTPAPQPSNWPASQPPKQPTAAPQVQPKPPSQSKGKDNPYSFLLLFLVPVLLVAALLFLAPSDGKAPAAPTDPPRVTTPAVTAPPETEPRPVLRQKARPSHGEIFEELTIEGLAPFSVTGTGDIYLVLDPIDLSDSVEAGAGEQQASLDEKYMEMRVFIRSGMEFETDVPLGRYEVYYATGDTWYGEEHLFGPDTQYYKCDGTFDFTEDSQGYNGWTLTLTAVYNGNLDTDLVDVSDFPK